MLVRRGGRLGAGGRHVVTLRYVGGQDWTKRSGSRVQRPQTERERSLSVTIEGPK